MDFNTFFELIKTETLALHPAEIVSTVTAIIYLILAARENIWCWFFGIISCSFWAWAAYFLYNLQIDALLQVFYVVISFWGLTLVFQQPPRQFLWPHLLMQHASSYPHNFKFGF